MLRCLHLAVLFAALLVFASAFQFPDGFLHIRQNTAPLVTGGTTGGETGAGTTGGAGGAATTVETAGESTITTPSTTSSPTSAPTAETTSPSSQAAPPSSSPSPITIPSSTAPTISPSTAPSSIAPSTSQPSVLRTTQTSVSTITSSSSASAPTSTPTTNSDTTTTVSDPTASEVLVTITYTSGGKLMTTSGASSAIASATSKPGFADGYGNSTNTLSEASKRIIAGLVGGIGGALLLAGIGFVIYRMVGRKKHVPVAQDEDYFSAVSSDSIAAQKDQGWAGGSVKSGWGKSSLTSRFAEPLERYRTEGKGSPTGSQGWKSPGVVNKASNF